MDFKLIEEILKQVSTISKRIKINWHGGEPLLLGLDIFKKIVETENKLESLNNMEFYNIIQTNATLINKQWIRFFKENNFRIGVSLDGPDFIHNKFRHSSNGEETFNRVQESVRMLQNAKIPFGVLAVITKESLGFERDLFNFFSKAKINDYDLLPCVEINHNLSTKDHLQLENYSLKQGDFSNFMNTYFDIWFTEDNPNIKIRFFEQAMIGLLGGKPNLCSFIPSCLDHINIETDGSVIPCGNLAAKYSNGKKITFGNVKNEEIKVILSNKSRQNFENSYSLPTECFSCEYFRCCGGGCGKYSYMWSGNWEEKNYFCLDRKIIFTHIIDVLVSNHPDMAERKKIENQNKRKIQ